MSRRTVVTSATLAAAVLAAYSVALGRAPIYLCDAEVLFALNARSVAATGHDINGRLLPLYFQVYGNMWFHPVLVYVSAVFLTVLPLAEWTVRLPSVAIGAVDVVLTYLVARRILDDERWGVVAGVLLAITPSHIIHSRLAMDYLYPVPFVLGWLLALTIYLERRRPWILFVAASILGLGCYSYIASLVMMPLYLAMTLAACVRDGDRRRHLAIALAGFVWPLVIIVPWVALHLDALAATAGRYQLSNLPTLAVTGASPTASVSGGVPLSTILQQLRSSTRFSGLTGRLSLYWYFFDPSFLFLMGGYASIIDSTRRVGVFLAPFAVFIPVGLYELARRGRVMDWIVVAGFATAPLAACLVVPEPYAIDRELELLPFAAIAAAFGLRRLATASARWARALAIGLVALLPLHLAFFIYDYTSDYPLAAAAWFEGNRRGAMEEIIARDARAAVPAIYLDSAIPYVDAYWKLYLMKHRREDLAARTVYVTTGELVARELEPRSLVMTMHDDKVVAALAAGGRLHEVAAPPEPGAAPQFGVFER